MEFVDPRLLLTIDSGRSCMVETVEDDNIIDCRRNWLSKFLIEELVMIGSCVAERYAGWKTQQSTKSFFEFGFMQGTP